MKPVIVTPKKLNLNPETLRLLNATDLERVAGGKPDKTDACTAGVCGTR
jgi:hypothetical protein